MQSGAPDTPYGTPLRHVPTDREDEESFAEETVVDFSIYTPSSSEEEEGSDHPPTSKSHVTGKPNFPDFIERQFKMAAERARLERLYPFNRHDPMDEDIPEDADDETALIILKDRGERVKSARQADLMTQMMGMVVTQNRTIKPPVFAGKAEEKAEAHLLIVEDWFAKSKVLDVNKVGRFNETLEGNARIWFSELPKTNLTWDKIKSEFTREFGKKGKTLRQLKREWSAYKFSPRDANIKEFIRDVKSTGDLLGHSDEEKLDTLREAMPDDVYTATINCATLSSLEKLLIELYTSRRTSHTAESSESPFMSLSLPPIQLTPKAQEGPSTADPNVPAFLELKIPADGSKPYYARVERSEKAFKPHTSPGGKGPGRKRKPRPEHDDRSKSEHRSDNYRDNRRYRDRDENRNKGNRRSHSDQRYDPQRTQRFTGAKPRQQPKMRDSDRRKAEDQSRCYNCNEMGHFARNCQQPKQPRTRYHEPQGSSQTAPKTQSQSFNKLQEFFSVLHAETSAKPQEN